MFFTGGGETSVRREENGKNSANAEKSAKVLLQSWWAETLRFGQSRCHTGKEVKKGSWGGECLKGRHKGWG